MCFWNPYGTDIFKSSEFKSAKTAIKKVTPTKPGIQGEQDTNSSAESDSASPAPVEAVPQTEDASSKKFTQLYLRLLTTQFSNDLDTLRRAADFKEASSVAILINALKQGQSLFSEAEKRAILGSDEITAV